jgi:hypothetical protein
MAVPEKDSHAPMTPVAYRVPLAVFVPVILCVGALALVLEGNLWWLLALPFVVLGSLCAAPNLNLADGFLTMVAVIIGVVISQFHAEAGTPIIWGAFASWLLSSFEKRIRMKPIYEEP